MTAPSSSVVELVKLSCSNRFLHRYDCCRVSRIVDVADASRRRRCQERRRRWHHRGLCKPTRHSVPLRCGRPRFETLCDRSHGGRRPKVARRSQQPQLPTRSIVYQPTIDTVEDSDDLVRLAHVTEPQRLGPLHQVVVEKTCKATSLEGKIVRW